MSTEYDRLTNSNGIEKPLISVILPYRNSESTIDVALSSITNQTYKNLEIIVVDDNSTDDTINIIDRYCISDARIKYLKMLSDDPNRYEKGVNTNAGYSARNSGFDLAKGDYITFQDADDASLLNRIEIQYNLLNIYKADHLTLDYFSFDKRFLNKELDIHKYFEKNKQKIFDPINLYGLSRRSKGLIAKLSPEFFATVPFSIKRKILMNKLFFGSFDSYPFSGNCPLFKRTITESVHFRKLMDRVWPSLEGRGADRDFNLQVAETFKNSYALNVPVYMWDSRGKAENRYPNIENFLLN